MNISFFGNFKKVISVTAIITIIFSTMTPVVFAGPTTAITVSTQT